MDTFSTIIESCRKAIGSIDADDREELIRRIMDCRKVFIYGSGRSGLAGQLFAVRLVQLGLDVHFVGEMTTPIIGPDDLCILISNTGRTSSVVQTAVIARRIGSYVISVTGTDDCELCRNSDRSIILDMSGTESIGDIAPLGTIFEDSTILFFDCIVHDIMNLSGSTEDEMRGRHAIWV